MQVRLYSLCLPHTIHVRYFYMTSWFFGLEPCIHLHPRSFTLSCRLLSHHLLTFGLSPIAFSYERKPILSSSSSTAWTTSWFLYASRLKGSSLKASGFQILKIYFLTTLSLSLSLFKRSQNYMHKLKSYRTSEPVQGEEENERGKVTVDWRSETDRKRLNFPDVYILTYSWLTDAH